MISPICPMGSTYGAPALCDGTIRPPGSRGGPRGLPESAVVRKRSTSTGSARSTTSCYRTMDFVLDALDELQETVFFTLADLLQLEIVLIFLDYPALGVSI